MITDATGQAVMILCSHRGPGFVQGERARVRYVAYNNKLVEMDMLERAVRGVASARVVGLKGLLGLGGDRTVFWTSCVSPIGEDQAGTDDGMINLHSCCVCDVGIECGILRQQRRIEIQPGVTIGAMSWMRFFLLLI